ncbi:MAG: hypothetical protein ABR612_05500 [Chromatocurvus sp.]
MRATHSAPLHQAHGTASTRWIWLFLIIIIQIFTALLMWTILPFLTPEDISGQPGDDVSRLAGSDFMPVVAARSEQSGDSAIISEMQPALRNGVQIGEAVFRAEPDLPAEKFSQLQLHLEGWRPGQKLFLFWRSSRAPDQQRFRELLHDTEGMSWHTLFIGHGWEGNILELAIGVFGAPGPLPLQLHEAILHPTGRSSLMQRLYWDWSRFQPWSYASLNSQGSSRPDILLKPATAAALWASLALLTTALCYAILRHLGRASPHNAAVAGLSAVLIPWLALDATWQAQLERQLQATQQRYAGLTQSEKHRRENDASLQAYAERVRDALAPVRGKRLFLINDAHQGHAYQRLRMQFHLLPLNIYNFGKQLLPPQEMRPGDYVLLLAPTTGIRYSAEQERLQDEYYRYRATLLDAHPFGQVLRIDSPATTGGQN